MLLLYQNWMVLSRCRRRCILKKSFFPSHGYSIEIWISRKWKYFLIIQKFIWGIFISVKCSQKKSFRPQKCFFHFPTFSRPQLRNPCTEKWYNSRRNATFSTPTPSPGLQRPASPISSVPPSTIVTTPPSVSLGRPPKAPPLGTSSTPKKRCASWTNRFFHPEASWNAFS